MTDELWMDLDKSDFTSERMKKHEEVAIKEYGEDEAKGRLRIDTDAQVTIEEIQDDLSILVQVQGKHHVFIKVKLDDEDVIRVLELLVKRVNKIKSMVEAMK